MAQASSIRDRYRIFHVQPSQILGILNWRCYENIMLPIYPELPDGYFVAGIEHCFERNSIALAICHPSFDPVPFGTPAPMIGRTLAQYDTIAIPIPQSIRDQLPVLTKRRPGREFL